MGGGGVVWEGTEEGSSLPVYGTGHGQPPGMRAHPNKLLILRSSFTSVKTASASRKEGEFSLSVSPSLSGGWGLREGTQVFRRHVAASKAAKPSLGAERVSEGRSEVGWPQRLNVAGSRETEVG